MKQSDKETWDNHWEKMMEIEKIAIFRGFSTELFISKLKTSITDQKLCDNLVTKKLEQTQNSQTNETRHLL